MGDRVRVLKEFNMDSLPRSVGNPRQHMVTKPSQFLRWIDRTDGMRTCYTSHNSYPNLNKHGDPKKVKVKNVFLDFDMDEKENLGFDKVARDVKLVDKFLNEEGVAHSISFSGNAGYHIYIHTKEEIMPLSNGLSLKYRALYAYLRNQLNLKTLDQRCAEPKRLCRIPGTKYCKDGNRTDRKCYPLSSDDEIIEKRKKMFKKSKEPLPDKGFRRKEDIYSITELMDRWDIEPDKLKDDDLYEFTDYKTPETNFLKLAGEFFRPCIRSVLFTKNPPHFIRMTSCMKIKVIFPLEKAITFYDRLSSEIGWIDQINKKKRDYNIRQIYSKNYNLPKCKKIKQEGYCIGEECEYFDE